MKVSKRLAAVMIALMTVIAVAGTSIPVEAAAKAPKKMTLKTTSKTVDIKGTATVSVKSVSPKGASTAVKYTSSNKKVATVSSKGVVTGKKAGKATITVTSKKNKKLKKTVKITVKQLKPTSISLTSKVAVKVGDKKTLKATVKPVGVYCPVTWSSNKKSVATVDKKGNVTAKAPGTATITVKTKEKNKKGKYLTKKCTVTVTAKEVKVTGLTFADKEKSLVGLGTTYTNKLTVAPSNATNKKVTYTSSDKTVATVDASGKVTTVKAGETTITATAADGSGKTASYKLTVVDRMNEKIDWQYIESADLIKNKDDYIIIDLRPVVINNEDGNDYGYGQGHIEGSVWVPAWPVGDKEKEELLRSSYVLEQLKDNEKDIVFICQSGAGGAKRAISVVKDAGIDVSRLYIQRGGGIDLIKNHKEELVTEGEFSGDFVISAADLKKKIDAKESIKLVDTRGIKTGTETAENAITMSWPMISNMPGAGEKGHARPLDAAAISKKLGELGLGQDDQIVLFSADHAAGGWGDDGRIAWQLLQCGYNNVKMVNGGLSAMKAAGIKTQTSPSTATAKAVTVTAVDTTTHDITTEALLRDFDQYTIIDVRANAEYEGATLYGEKSGGHIKGAVHIRFTDLFRYDGSLKSNDELTKLFENADITKDKKVVTYCTGGIRSAYMQLVLQMLGYENSYNYAESAYRWSNTASAGTADKWEKAFAVTELKFAKTELALGATEQTGSVKLRVIPSYADNKNVTYKSSDEKVATVDKDGKVTSTGYGEAVITATSVGNPAITASYTVKVEVPAAVEARQVYVSPEWVKSAIDGQQPGYEQAFISEVSWGALEGAKAYKAGHVKGAYHINSDEVEYDDCDPWPNGDGKDDFGLYDEKDIAPEDNFNIRSADQLGVFLKRKGITKDTKVILYGKSASDSSITRVAFAMLYAGVEDVKVIDGGMEAWTKAGIVTETDVHEPAAGGESYSFGATIPVHSEYIMSIETVKDKLERDPNFRLVSIRSEDEFVGKKTGYAYIKEGNAGEPLGAVWGHDTDDGYYVQNGKVASIDKVAEILAESGSSLENEISFYCGTGWRATIPFLICYQAGYDNISLYDGGWWLWQLKWEKDPENWPIQRVSPADAVNHVELKFAENEITTDVDGHMLSVAGLTAAKNELKVIPARVAANITYSSSDETVATVAEDGTVTIVKSGEATETTITAEAKNGSKASYKVIIKDRMNDDIDWQYVTAEDAIKGAADAENPWIIIDTRPREIPQKEGSAIADAGYFAGHIEGSLWVNSWPVGNKAAEETLRKAVTDEMKEAGKKVVIVCQSGAGGAKRAISVLKEAGVPEGNLFILTGGGIELITNHLDKLAVKPKWTADAFSYSEDGAVITGLTEKGMETRKENPFMVMPNTSPDGTVITEIAAGPATNNYGLFGAENEPITEVILPEKLEKIGAFSFKNCGLEEIIFPDGLKEIEGTAFQMDKLREVILPDSVTTVGAGAFTSNYTLEKVVISKSMTEVPASFVSCPTGDAMKGFTEIIIPENITSIGSRAFSGNCFVSVEVPESVKSIGSYAFSQKNSDMTIAEIILHEGLERVDSNAFQNTLVKEVQIPSTVTTLNKNAFNGCTDLKVYTYNKAFLGTAYAGVSEVICILTDKISGIKSAMEDMDEAGYTEGSWSAMTEKLAAAEAVDANADATPAEVKAASDELQAAWDALEENL